MNKARAGKQPNLRWGISWPNFFLFGKKFHKGHLLLWVVIAALIYIFAAKSYQRFYLAGNGHVAKALVFKSKDVGGKGTVYYYYSFWHAGNRYENYTGSDTYEVGKYIYILFDEADPDNNLPLKEIERKFSERLKQNTSYNSLKLRYHNSE